MVGGEGDHGRDGGQGVARVGGRSRRPANSTGRPLQQAKKAGSKKGGRGRKYAVETRMSESDRAPSRAGTLMKQDIFSRGKRGEKRRRKKCARKENA